MRKIDRKDFLFLTLKTLYLLNGTMVATMDLGKRKGETICA
ncbi:hypothetical protein DB29_03738 [Shouchella clausii]|nr:hypothetical protein DB29_03738 [Shouchella clausii]